MAREQSQTQVNSQRITNYITSLIEDGVAPWQQTIDYNGRNLDVINAPLGFNVATGKEYSGLNQILAESAFIYKTQGRGTFENPAIPAYLTLKQAEKLGGTIRDSEVSNEFPNMIPVIYSNYFGRDENGKSIRLPEPSLMVTYAFNIDQFENLPTVDLSEYRERFEERQECYDICETIIRNSGVNIKIDAKSFSSYYTNRNDTIHIPSGHGFHVKADDARDKRYIDIIRGLCYRTGFEKGKERPQFPPGSPESIDEELVSNIACYFACRRLGLGYFPGERLDDQLSIESLQSDPNKIGRIAKIADEVASHVLSLQHEKMEEQEVIEELEEVQDRTDAVSPEHDEPEYATERVNLKLAYDVRFEARKIGCDFDKVAKTWFAPEGVDLTKARKLEEKSKKIWEEKAKSKKIKAGLPDNTSQQSDQTKSSAVVQDESTVEFDDDEPYLIKGNEQQQTEMVAPSVQIATKITPVKIIRDLKDKVKALNDKLRAEGQQGARYNPKTGMYDVQPGAPLSGFLSLQKESDALMEHKRTETIEHALKQMYGNGLSSDFPEGRIVFDDKIHRAPTDKNKSNFAYKLRLEKTKDGCDWRVIGWCQNHENGRGSIPIDPVQPRMIQANRQAAAQEVRIANQEDLELGQNRSAKAFGVYVNAQDAQPEHPYQLKKGAGRVLDAVPGLKEGKDGSLIVPVLRFNEEGNIRLVSIQSIKEKTDDHGHTILDSDDSPEFIKPFFKGAPIGGGFFYCTSDNTSKFNITNNPFDSLQEGDRIVVCEGLATLETAKKANPDASLFICTFGAGNSVNFAKSLCQVCQNGKLQLPDGVCFTFAAENDENLVGVNKAKEAATILTSIVPKESINIRVPPPGFSDFNDAALALGLKAAKLPGPQIQKSANMSR